MQFPSHREIDVIDCVAAAVILGRTEKGVAYLIELMERLSALDPAIQEIADELPELSAKQLGLSLMRDTPSSRPRVTPRWWTT